MCILSNKDKRYLMEQFHEIILLTHLWIHYIVGLWSSIRLFLRTLQILRTLLPSLMKLLLNVTEIGVMVPAILISLYESL